ncbi:hypothetical protein GCM10011579_035970 [Streptomyces albiflavescens]|uniref:Uncharacterized protein n=1 Tax=Streptomyces albiflavescens TaxID=1623582 RepID=A0A917Y3S5_9ACTN|nr:hypothetical protein [Streptomyces albiflavescens]GGN65487.1 hypothetical protein GCM10011579_035970 [Streptomyces albiflavescens]
MIGSLDETCEELVRVRPALETANVSAQRQLKDRVHSASGATDRAGVALADPVSDLVAQLQSTVGNPVKALTGAPGTATGLVSSVLGVLGVVAGLLGGVTSAVPALPTT